MNLLGNKIVLFLIGITIGVVIGCGVVYFLASSNREIEKITTTKAEVQQVLTETIEKKENDAKTYKTDLADLAKEKSKVVKTNDITGLKKEISFLKREIEIKDAHIKRLNLTIVILEDNNQKSLDALNKSIAVMQKKELQNKALKIGSGVGIGLALVGGFVGGLYTTKLIKF